MVRMLKKVSYILLGLLLLIFLAYETAVFVFSYYPNRLTGADAIIVLGSGYSDSAKGRAGAGLDLYKKGLAPLIILSGGKTNSPTSEAKYMADYIRSKASTTPKMLLEDKSTNTVENLKMTYDKVAGTVKSVIIVSDGFHLLRSYLIAKRVGFEDVEWYSAERAGAVRENSLWRDNYNESIKLISEIPILFGFYTID